MPADSTHAGGSPQRATAEQAKAPRRANDDAQPPETRGGVPSEAPSKKRQRDAQRLAEHRERQRVAPILARWALLARQPLRAVRRIRRDEVWTGWMREATERKQEARRKLRDVLRPYAPGRSGLAATSRCRAPRSRRLGVWCIPSAERRSRRCRCATSSS